jgi:phosphoenolpyruvate carboxylase
METLSDIALVNYRDVIREDPDFVQYFRSVTPEQELGKLALGSRPAKRKATGGVESLRAIPWIFAWTQIRLMLPAWLGSETALKEFIDQGRLGELQAMTKDWPFFQTYIDMLEMVLSKADKGIALYYEKVLCPDKHSALGEDLRQRLDLAIKLVLQIKQQTGLLDHSPRIGTSMALRNPYTDPLHYLQAELMRRTRIQPDNQSLEHALKVTMAGIAAGMRNTG